MPIAQAVKPNGHSIVSPLQMQVLRDALEIYQRHCAKQHANAMRDRQNEIARMWRMRLQCAVSMDRSLRDSGHD